MNKTKTLASQDPIAIASLDFLQRSSQLLATKSPHLSAYLGAQKQALATHVSVLAGRDEDCKTCGTCANILIPGWSCKKHGSKPSESKSSQKRKRIIEDNSNPGQQKRSTTGEQSKLNHVAYKCDLCHSLTKFKQPVQKTAKASKPAVSSNTSSDQLSKPILQSEATTSHNVRPAIQTDVSDTKDGPSRKQQDAGPPSKKRSKKSKMGGLAAMLAKSKSESSSPALGFDLMDFMKTG